MVLNMSLGFEFRINKISEDVTKFEKVCETISMQSGLGKYNLMSVTEESKKLTSAFQEIVENIDSMKPFLTENGVLKEGSENFFFTLSEFDDRVRKNFSKAMESLQKCQPLLVNKTAEIFSGKNEEIISRVYVYYDGPGHLFIRGEGAEMRMAMEKTASIAKPVEYGRCEKLSWDRGLPLVRESDHLWKATLIADDGQIPNYKFLISDCLWSEGQNYTANGAKSIVHIPAFDQRSSSILVPFDAGFGNRLVLCGTGKIFLRGQPVELSWEKGVELSCIGSSLWALQFGAKEAVEFKLCLLKQTGELIWEEGLNRELKTGQEIVLTPYFGPGVGRKEQLETASQTLGMHLYQQQEIVREQKKEELEQERAQIQIRPLPCLIKADAKSFPDNAIFQVNDPVRIEEVILDGSPFQFYYTHNQKAILIQDAPEGCTAGVSAMLIMDNGGKPKAVDIKNRKASTYEQIIEDIRNAGLEPLSTPVLDLQRSLKLLRQAIQAHGSAYVSSLSNENAATGHAIIVDEISEDLKKVRIRDPWHGWECIVSGDVFKEYWNNATDRWDKRHIVQVKNGK